MRSALVFSSTERGESYEAAFVRLLAFVRRLSDVLGERCELLLQHSFREEKMAFMIEIPGRVFGGYGITFEEAVEKTIQDVCRKIPEMVEEPNALKKPGHESKARVKGGQRSRRKSPSRKRGDGSRKR